MTRELKPILLNSYEYNTPIMKCIGKIPFGSYFEVGKIYVPHIRSISGNHQYWQPQYLYLVSDNSFINDGEWYYQSCLNRVTKWSGFLTKHKEDAKVVATTDPKLIAEGIPSIGEGFLIEFAEYQGKYKIMVEIDNLAVIESETEKGCMMNNLNYMKPKLDKFGNAILGIIPDDDIKEPLIDIKGNPMYCSTCGKPLTNGEILLLGYCETCVTEEASNDSEIESKLHLYKCLVDLESVGISVNHIELIAEQAFKKRWEQWQYDYKGFKGWIEREFKAGVNVGWEECKKHYNIKD